jgi:hypothetical protein
MCSFLTVVVSKPALRSLSSETHAHLFFIQMLLNRQQLYPHVSPRTQQEWAFEADPVVAEASPMPSLRRSRGSTAAVVSCFVDGRTA